MKKWILSLIVVTLISGCSTTPDTPKPHPEKYTFQVISLEIPETTGLTTSPTIEELMHHPDATIIDYPIVIAGLGESVTNDQTKSVLLAEDFSVIDGKAVAEENTHKLGHLVSVAVNEIKNDAVSYHLNAQYNEVVGYDDYDLGGGLAVKMPRLERRSVDTELKQKPNSWVMLGGLVDERSDGKKMRFMMGVKIIPPATHE